MKLPPQNLDAEKSILAGCLLFADMAEEAISLVRGTDFYSGHHQIIFSVIHDLYQSKEPVDLTTVVTRLNDQKKLADVGGAGYIAGLVDTPVPSSMIHYAKLIQDASTLRQTIALCQHTINACFDGGKTNAEIVNALQSASLDLGADTTTDTFVTMADLSQQSLIRYGELREDDGNYRINTGFSELDNLTGGIRGSKLVIIAARPSVGKTAFMCNMIENMAASGIMTGVFELEMDKEELDDRWNASLAAINMVRLTSSTQLTSKEWRDLNESGSYKSTWPVVIDDSGGLKVDELVRRARKMKRMGCRAIFIDQLSEIRSSGKKSVFEMNTEHVEALGRLKKELRIPIFLLAQLNRELEKRPDKKPILSDLKNTGMLEEKADMVLLGYRKFIYTKDDADERHAEWNLAKHRGGPTRDMKMQWIPKQARFIDGGY